MNQQLPQAPIPDSLQVQLDAFRRQLWRIKITEAVFAGVVGLCLSFLLLFVSDRFWNTPWWLALIILLVGMLGFALFLPWMLHKWVWKNRRANQLARVIAKSDARFGDRLLGIVELQNQDAKETALSETLRQAAMRQVAEEASKRDFSASVPRPRHLLWAGASAVIVAMIVVLGIFIPEATVNALQRWINPLGKTERYTFTQLQAIPSSKVVPMGEAFEFELKLAPTTRKRPPTAQARLSGGQTLQANLQNDGYLFKFAGIQSEQLVDFSIGDANPGMLVIPKRRPGLLEATACINYPEYIGKPASTQTVRGGVISAVRGSSAAFSARSSNPLSRVEAQDKTVFKVDGANLASEKLQFDQPRELVFSWIDADGLRGETAYRLRIEPIEDQAPSPYIQGVDRSKVVLGDEAFSFDVAADDDFALQQIGIEWQGEFTKTQPGQPAKGELILQQGSKELNRLSKNFTFSAAAMGIVPQRLTIRPFALDYLPGRQRVYGEPIVVHVMDKNEHAQMLKERLESLSGVLEDLTRREENLLDESKRLERMDAADLKNQQGQQRLKEQAQQEAESRERMKELQQKLEELFKDAARNDQVEKKALQDLQQAMEELRPLPEQEMKKAQQKLDEAAKDKNTADKTKKELAEATKQQQQAVDKMKKALEKTNQASKNFEASTFVARLKKAAGEEDGIASMYLSLLDRTLGLGSDDLDPTLQRSIDGMARQHELTAGDIRWLREDLSHFYLRNNEQVYQQIAKEMGENEMDKHLEEMLQRLEANHAAWSIDQTRALSAKLNKWAKMLSDSAKKPGGGGGGGGGGGDDQGMSESDFEFMLRVMRMIQQQQDLRARTRALEQLKRDNALETPANPAAPSAAPSAAPATPAPATASGN